MAKTLSTNVHDIINTGEDANVAVELPAPPTGPAESIPAWEDRPVLHEVPERDPRSQPAHEDRPPARRSGER